MKKLTGTYKHFSLTAALVLIMIVSSCKNKQAVETKEAMANLENPPKKEYTQFVFETTNLYRYQFPTHINDIVIDRAQSENSEVFIVIVENGKSVHHHKHDDTEQVFYMIEGTGILSIGENKKESPVKPGDVVRIPAKVLHSIRPNIGENIKYLSIDCFGAQPPLEPTWDEHVQVMCKEQGHNYNDVVKSNKKK